MSGEVRRNISRPWTSLLSVTGAYVNTIANGGTDFSVSTAGNFHYFAIVFTNMKVSTFPKKIKVTDVTFTTTTAGGGGGGSFSNSLLNGLGLFSGASYVDNTTPPRLELSAYGSGTVTNVDFPEYQTLNDIQTAGYKTLTEIQALGYQTIASLTTAGYKTAAATLTDVASVGYQTLATLTSNGYKTAADTLVDVASAHYSKTEIDTEINGIKNRSGSSTLNNAISALENNTGSSALKTAVDTNTDQRAKARGTFDYSGGSTGSGTLSNAYNASASIYNKSTAMGWNHMGSHSFYQIDVTFTSSIPNSYQVLVQETSTSTSTNVMMSSCVRNKTSSGFSIYVFNFGTVYIQWGMDFVVI